MSLPNHNRSLDERASQSAEMFLQALEKNPYSPPTDLMIDGELLNYLGDEGKVTRATGGIVFSIRAYVEMRDAVIKHIEKQGSITVAEVRDLFATTRKYALALMEHLDETRITRRVGDERILR